MLYLLLQFIIKDADEQPEEEGQRARSGSVPSEDFLSPGVGVPPSQHRDAFTNPEAL